jgi:methionyl-tRNA synthetase
MAGKSIREDIADLTENLRFDNALSEIWKIVQDLNAEIERNKPWELAKTDQKKLSEVLSFVYQNLYGVAELLSPYLPETSKRMLKQLKDLEPEPLFPRLEK